MDKAVSLATFRNFPFACSISRFALRRSTAGYSIRIPSEGVDAPSLYEWCTDFRDDDAAMLEREQGVDASFLLERKVSGGEGRARIEMRLRLAGQDTTTLVEIDLHPSELAYVADIRFGDVYRQICTYLFAPVPGGSEVTIVAYVEKSEAGADGLATSGDFVAELREGMRKLMTGFVRQAEKELGAKRENPV
jgi:hypothetical protein